jgi:dipeptidyl aminopeptidase/acylaminoacyl peptidase
VGITGCSYGGYFTLQSLRAYPDLFAAGNAQCSLTDLTEEFTFGFGPFIAYLMGHSPMADPAEYLRDSPYHGAGDIRAKVLLFHGTADFLPVQLLSNIHDELDASAVPVTFLRVAGEGHGFSAPKSQEYAAQLQIEFFREHLVEADAGPAPTYGRTAYLPALYDRAAP